MALERIPAISVPNPPVQVMIEMSSTTAVGTQRYTVPANRKFEGFFVAPASTEYIGINGIILQPPAGTTMVPLTLTAGTTVSQGTSNGNARVIGVESDA